MKTTKRQAFATIRLNDLERELGRRTTSHRTSPGAYDPQGIDVFPQDDSFADTRRCGVLIPIRRMNHTALETRGRVADALRGLAAALTDLFALRRPPDAPLWESFDDMAWGLSDIAETLTRLDRAFNETPHYRTLRASARNAARAVEELEEAWTQLFLDPKCRPDVTRWGPRPDTNDS